MTLCEHQSTLTDPITNNAKCVHQRMLSDDVQRCMGVMNWYSGNLWLIMNINYPGYKSVSNTVSSVYECIYKRGNWRHSCGSEVEAMMGNLTKSYSNLAKLTVRFIGSFKVLRENICDVYNPGSDLTKYDKLNKLRNKSLKLLLFQNQSPYLFTQCKVVNYPLNQCHLRVIWRRDVYAMFCHQVRSVTLPVLTPQLPLCELGNWVRSAARICNMGYDRFMDTASHIARCTKDKDELFPCYKGLYAGLLSWSLVSAGRIFHYDTFTDGLKWSTVYSRIKQCFPRLYDHLRHTCRHGPPVVQLIQDLRTVLKIDAPAMFSLGVYWHQAHLHFKRIGIRVNHC